MKKAPGAALWGVLAAAALILHFWPMAYWSHGTLLFFRGAGAFCAQMFFLKQFSGKTAAVLPLIAAGLLAGWGVCLRFLSGDPGISLDYALPLLCCVAGWPVWAAAEKQTRWLPALAHGLGAAFMCSVVLIPAAVILLLYLGWPPVIGNLTAARAMDQYAAQVYPEWEAEDIWAGFNPVDNGYYQEFTDGTNRYSLSSNRTGSRVWDDARADAYRQERGINDALSRLNAGYGYAMFWVNWSSGAPDFPLVTLRVDLSDGPEVPVPDEAAMREKMADRALEVYEAIAPLTPIHKFAVLYHHPALDEEDVVGSQWYRIEVILSDEIPLERDDILRGTITKR